MRKLSSLLLLISVFNFQFSIAQVRSQSSSEILFSIKKLNTVGSVLYLAAHPDDENTRLIAYLSKDRLVRTGYLSLTRGDGGQNLIGTEFAEKLGVIRTQELLEARKRDGGEQFFTRAVDFGFSKSFDEALALWERDKVLADVVWVIRKFRPDVIITRFPPDSRAGHGHHSSSAILGAEAFKKAADPNAYPDQLKFVQVWQAKRILFNTGNFFAKGSELDKSDFLKIDVGSYNPLIGKSVNEIASESRSQHKSQGFGVPLARGSQIEYFQYLEGEKPTTDLFDGIDLTWKRIKGGEKISQKIAQIEKNFDMNAPDKSLPELADLYKNISQNLSEPDNLKGWVEIKQKELEKIILACAGVYAEAVTDDYSAVAGENIEVKVNVINRSNYGLTVESIATDEPILNNLAPEKLVVHQILENNKVNSFTKTVSTSTMKNSQFYWLVKPWKTIYTIEDQKLIGLPENPPAVSVNCIFGLPNGQVFSFKMPVQYKWTDRVEGEEFRPFIITPAATANLSDHVIIFKDSDPKTVSVNVLSHQKDLKGSVKLDLPSGWRSEPAEIPFEIVLKNQQQKIDFKVFPPKEASESTFKVLLKTNTKEFIPALSWQVIDYPHITKQALMNESQAKVVRLDLKIAGKKIAYIMGAGDKIPESLRQIGYEVTMVAADAVLAADLTQFDAVLVGIRAYNTEAGLVSANSKLLKYVENGGKMIVQYNTNGDMLLQNIAPYPISFGRERVTEENSAVEFVDTNHPVLNFPNKITSKDFEGWVQERGLNFASTWDPNFTPVLSWNDKGEQPLKGGLLACKYGKGTYIFTGISFFRQLPAGVPGAYRLLANMIAY